MWVPSLPCLFIWTKGQAVRQWCESGCWRSLCYHIQHLQWTLTESCRQFKHIIVIYCFRFPVYKVCVCVCVCLCLCLCVSICLMGINSIGIFSLEWGFLMMSQWGTIYTLLVLRHLLICSSGFYLALVHLIVISPFPPKNPFLYFSLLISYYLTMFKKFWSFQIGDQFF